jgi:hypothetical protein
MFEHIDWKDAIALLSLVSKFNKWIYFNSRTDDSYAISDLQENGDQEYATKFKLWTHLEACHPKLLGWLRKYKEKKAAKMLLFCNSPVKPRRRSYGGK